MINIYSQYTKPEGSIKFIDLIAEAKKNNFNALGLTDHGNFAGIVDFYKQTIMNGIKPIIGLDIFCRLEDGKFIRLIIYIQNKLGYEELLDIFARSIIIKDKIRYIDIKEMRKIDLTNLFMVINTYQFDYFSLLLDIEENLEIVFASLIKIIDVFPDKVYFQLVWDGNKNNEIMARQLISLSNKYDKIKLLAVNPIYYVKKTDYKIKELLLKISDKKNVYPTDFNHRNQYLTSLEESFNIFPKSAFENKKYIIDKCNFFIENIQTFRKQFLMKTSSSDDYTENEPGAIYIAFRKNILELYDKFILQANETRKKSLDDLISFELEYIKKNKLMDFFITLKSLKSHFFSKNKGTIFFKGKISYFFTAFLLKLTISRPDIIDVDCMRYSLTAENFYQKINIVVSTFQKNMLIDFLKMKFGKDNIYRLSEYVTWMSNAIIKSLGKELDFSKEKIDFLIKAIPPQYRHGTLKELLRKKELQLILSENMLNRKFFKFANLLDGGFKNFSINSQSIIIGDEYSGKIIPVSSKDKDDTKITFFNLETAKRFGLLTITITSFKYLELFNKISYQNYFLSKKELSLLAKNLIESIQKDDIKFIPFYKSLKKYNAHLLSLNRLNYFYNLLLYLQTDKTALEIQSHRVKNIRFFKHTGGKIVYKEQLVYIFEKLFGKYCYYKQRKRVYQANSLQLLKKILPNFDKNSGDKENIEFIKNHVLQSVFYSRLSDGLFKIFSALYFQKIKNGYPKDFYIFNFIEAINSRSIDFFKDKKNSYLTYLKKIGDIKAFIGKFSCLNPIKEAFYSDLERTFFLPLYVVKGISLNVSDLLCELFTNNSRDDFSDIIKYLVDNKISKNTIELLIKIGYFDDVNKNRKENLTALENLYSLFSENQIPLFNDFGGVDDFSLLEKIAFEKELIGISFFKSRIKYIDLFKPYLKFLNNNVVGTISSFDDKTIYLIDNDDRRVDLTYNNLKIDPNRGCLIEYECIDGNALGNIKRIVKYKAITSIFELDFVLILAINSTNDNFISKAIGMLRKYSNNETNNCSLLFIFSDTMDQVTLDFYFTVNQDNLMDLLKLFEPYPFYFTIAGSD